MPFPTTEPASERILLSIERALEEISPNDQVTDYWNTVRYVLRHDAGYPVIPGYPACVVTVNGKDIEDDLSSDVHSLNEESLSLRIDAWIENASNVSRDMQRIERDVRTALMREPRRPDSDASLLAIHTFIESVTYIDTPEVNTPLSLVEIDVAVKYRTRIDQLETVQV